MWFLWEGDAIISTTAPGWLNQKLWPSIAYKAVDQYRKYNQHYFTWRPASEVLYKGKLHDATVSVKTNKFTYPLGKVLYLVRICILGFVETGRTDGGCRL